MSKTPNYDAKVKTILDATRSGERTCALTGEKWMMTDEEIGWYKKFNVPPSDRSPLTRIEIRMGFYLGYQWWNHKHPATGKPIISYIHPATGVKVISDEEWFGEDFSTIHLAYDPQQSFFDQIHRLQLQVPMPASRNIKKPENSIAVVSGGDRNSYFMVGCDSENSLYSFWASKLVNSAEVNNTLNVIDSYSINNSKNVHKSLYVRDSADVMNSAFVFSCDDVEYCFGVVNKKHKKYLFWNKPLSQGAYEAEMAKIDFRCRDAVDGLVARFRDMVGTEAIWPQDMGERNINCTGEYNYDGRDCQQCYACVQSCSNLFWCQHGVDGHDSAFSSPIWSSDCYEADNMYHCRDMRFSFACYRSQGLEYCFMNYDCENCFGCVGLHHKKFHIFNKPYSEKEYWQLVDEIKCRMLEQEEYGNFFPLSMSLSYFGQSGSVLYLGTSPDAMIKLGALKFDPESSGAVGDLATAGTKKASEIPNCIDDIKDKDWLGKTVYDENFQRRFSFIKPELDFYRRHTLAVPNQHFVKRMIDLLQEANLGVFEPRTCAKCEKNILVAKNLTYPHRTIYCRSCYLAYLEKNG